MITLEDILETNRMIKEQNLDVRTITMGISLRDCADPVLRTFCDKIYEKITRQAEHLVKVGEDIEAEYGVPIINKRISVTPIAIAAEACRTRGTGPGGENRRREFHRRLFRPGSQGLYQRRPDIGRFDS